MYVCIYIYAIIFFKNNSMQKGLTCWGREKFLPFAKNIFRFIFLNEKHYILIQISLKFVPNDPISNELALVQIMA